MGMTVCLFYATINYKLVRIGATGIDGDIFVIFCDALYSIQPLHNSIENGDGGS